jgi:hypothetical protein
MALPRTSPDPPRKKKRTYYSYADILPKLKEVDVNQLKANSVRPELVKDYFAKDLRTRINDEPLFDTVNRAAKQTGLDPAFLFSAIQEEGFDLFTKDARQGKISGDYPVSGFMHLGLDTFGNRIKDVERIVPGFFKEGKNVQYPEAMVNEDGSGKMYQGANFKTPYDGMVAVGALLQSERKRVQDYAKQKELDLSPEQLDYFNYISYVAGPARVRKYIDKYNEEGMLKDDNFIKDLPYSSWNPTTESGTTTHSAEGMAMRRMANKTAYRPFFYEDSFAERPLANGPQDMPLQDVQTLPKQVNKQGEDFFIEAANSFGGDVGESPAESVDYSEIFD